MPLRLLPWAPEYGPGLQATVDEAADDTSSVSVDTTIEGEWRAIMPSPGAGRPPVVQIVDGVRRAEAHAMDDGDGPDRAPLFGLFGSLAVGAVRCEAGGARVMSDVVRVERHYLQAGGEPVDRELTAGAARLTFRASVPPGATAVKDLLADLQERMLAAEARLAEQIVEQAEDEDVLTIVDGPLRLRSPGAAVVGYVKRVENWYVDADAVALLSSLRVGERTSLFRLSAGQLRRDRYSWYLRVADLGGLFHPLASLVRLEASGALPVAEAVRLADRTALAIPRLASSPVRDPRAPQNLTPVGALEATLTRRLGDRQWVRRRLSAELAAAQAGAAG